MKKIILFSIIVIANFLVLTNNLRFEMYENGVYYKYLISIVNDFDFNIFNQMESEFDRWMVSQSYNHPDYHSPFISVLLFPTFLIYSFFTLFIANPFFLSLIPYQVFITSRVLVGMLIFKNSSQEDRQGILLPSLILVALSSWSWSILFDNTEISYLCLLFTFPIFYQLRDWLNGKDINQWFFALNIALFSCIKPDGVPWIICIAFLVLIRKDWKLFGICSLVGLIAVGQFLLVNWIRYDAIMLSHPVAQLFPNSVFFIYFGPNGLLAKVPLVFVAHLGLIYLAFRSQNKNERILSVAGLLIIFIKNFMIGSAVPTNTEDTGSRLFIAELPFYAFGLSAILKNFKLSYKWIGLIFLPLTLWQLVMWLFNYFLDSADYRILWWLSPQQLISALPQVILHYQSRLGEITHYFHYFLLLSIVCAVITLAFCWPVSKFKTFPQKVLWGLMALVLLSSTLNFVCNQKNAQTAKEQGAFENVVVAKKDALFYDEAVDLIHYTEKQKEIGLTVLFDLEKYRDDYMLKVKDNLIYDPIGLKQDIENKKYRPSFWQLKYP